MQPRFWSFRMFAALWGILLAPLVPAGAQSSEPAAWVPVETLACLEWKNLVDDESRLPEMGRAILHAPPVQRALAEHAADAVAVFELIEALVREQGAVALLAAGPDEDLAYVGAAVVRAPKNAGQLAEMLRGLVVAMSPEATIGEEVIGGVKFARVALPDGPPLYWSAVDEHLLVSLGGQAAQQVMEVLKGEAASLAYNDEYRLTHSKVGQSASPWYLGLFMKFHPLLDYILEEAQDDQETILALQHLMDLDRVESFHTRMDRSDYGVRLVSYTHISGGERKGLFVEHRPPLTDDDVAIVPRDAYWAWLYSIDLAGFWNDAAKRIEAWDPDIRTTIDGGLAMASSFLGFSPTDDLLPALGDSFAIYDAPGHGGLLLTGMVIVGETRNREALHGILTRVVEFLKPLLAQHEIEIEQRSMQRDGNNIHYVLVAGLPIPVAPAWGFVEDRFVLGLFPQTVAVALRQADPKTRGPSLLDHPDYQVVRPTFPPEIVTLAYSDARRGQPMAYAIAQAIHTAVASLSAGGSYEYDLATVPSFADTYADTRAMIGCVAISSDGVWEVNEGFSPAAYLSGTNMSVVVIALLISILLPSLSRARELAKRAVSASNLRAIGQGLHIYANDHGGKFPESLETLIEQGMITRETLNSPRDEEGRVSYTYIAGQSETNDPRNVIAHERVMGDEGTNVLFLDGHVEWLPPERFVQALVETYQRLGRVDELPEDIRDLQP